MRNTFCHSLNETLERVAEQKGLEILQEVVENCTIQESDDKISALVEFYHLTSWLEKKNVSEEIVQKITNKLVELFIQAKDYESLLDIQRNFHGQLENIDETLERYGFLKKIALNVWDKHCPICKKHYDFPECFRETVEGIEVIFDGKQLSFIEDNIEHIIFYFECADEHFG